jgi:hypothetical protein
MTLLLKFEDDCLSRKVEQIAQSGAGKRFISSVCQARVAESIQA